MQSAITLYCDNSGVVANSKKLRSHKRGKHIARKYHLIREIVGRGDLKVSQIALENNLADPFTKCLTEKIFDHHVEGMRVRYIGSWFESKWEIARVVDYKPCFLLVHGSVILILSIKLTNFF